jgi:hypothetical protein
VLERDVLEGRVGLVRLHDFGGEEQEHPYAGMVSLVRNVAWSLLAYLAPMTMVLPLRMNFSNSTYMPPGSVPNAVVVSSVR